MEEHKEENKKSIGNQKQMLLVSAIIIAGAIIAGAILVKGGPNTPETQNTGIPVVTATLSPVSANDRILGNSNAKVTIVMYEDFQCIFCGAASGLQPDSTPLIQSLKQRDAKWTPFMLTINDYIKNGTVRFVYRDYAFLGPESIEAAEAARCAGDQGKFWEYHDYLFSHQGTENSGNFSNTNLESFAKTLNLDTTSFNKCLDGGKYAQAVADSKTEGDVAGVGKSGTPEGFILRDGKVVSTIDGAEPAYSVKLKIDAALK